MIPHLLTLKDYWYLHPFPFSFLSLHTLFAPSVQSTFVQDPNIFADYTRLPLMAQPDYQNLSACLTEEFALFEKSLLAYTNRALINSINELRNELHRTAAEARAHINETKREIETLRTDIMSRMEASETNATARLHNSRISNLETAFHPVRDHQNVVPDMFPANGYALLTLNYYELNTLLERYHLVENGSPRRYLLAKFIGVANYEYY